MARGAIEPTRKTNRDALKEKLARQGELTWQLARLETEWLDVSDALEKLGG